MYVDEILALSVLHSTFGCNHSIKRKCFHNSAECHTVRFCIFNSSLGLFADSRPLIISFYCRIALGLINGISANEEETAI